MLASGAGRRQVLVVTWAVPCLQLTMITWREAMITYVCIIIVHERVSRYRTTVVSAFVRRRMPEESMPDVTRPGI